MDPSRATELTNLIQFDAEIPINPELLALVDQALTRISSGRARNLERLSSRDGAAARHPEFIDRHHADSQWCLPNLQAQPVGDVAGGSGFSTWHRTASAAGAACPGDRSAESRLRADAAEALIALAGASAALTITVGYPPLVCHRPGGAGASPVQRQTALQEWSQARSGIPRYATEECSQQHGDLNASAAGEHPKQRPGGGQRPIPQGG